jgi:hypothetical protein
MDVGIVALQAVATQELVDELRGFLGGGQGVGR